MQKYKTPRTIQLNMAANTFLCIRTRKWNYVIRMGYLLKDEINPERLRRAVKDIWPRFPSFFVAARRGLFSYYLECMDHTDIVQKEGDYFCRPFDLFSKDTPMIRIVYDGCRFAVEIPHAVCDGKGLTVFTRALLARYLGLDDVIDLDEPPRAEELSDDYRRFCTETKGKIPKDSAAWQCQRPDVENYLKVIHGAIPLEDILSAAKARGLSVTEYLMCAYLYAFYCANPNARGSEKPIKLRIPVNMRQFYPSETLHNFTLYRNLGFVPSEKEDWSFEDVVEAMRGVLKPCTTPEAMRLLLDQTVTLSGNPILRAVPIALKRWFFKLGYYLTGEKPMTGVLSNLGRVELPPGMAECVESVEFIMGGSIFKSLCAFVLSDHRNLHIYLSGACKSTDVQDELFRLLAQEGLRVTSEKLSRK
jgi:NRPS condensation-like uncharacterized protein